MEKTQNRFIPGLEGVVASQTRLSHIDGTAGELYIGGFALEEIAPKATFEELVYLLQHDALPNAQQLDKFSRSLVPFRTIPEVTTYLLARLAPHRLSVMDALRMGVDTLSVSSEGEGLDRDRRDAQIILGGAPTIVASYWRMREGLDPVPPREDLSHVGNYLYMLAGEDPGEARIRGMETYFNTVIDHGLNASTFTARVITSTQSDLISAVVGAIGALKGPLHGGAPGPALDMVFEIGSPEAAEGYLRAKLDRGERLMGFGHRVYKVRDPRADVLSAAAEAMYRADGDMQLYELARSVEKTAIALLEEKKPGRNLQTNVEYYTALLLHGLGFPVELFTPTFAVSRTAGWLAHCFEQRAAARLIRPSSEYIGVVDRSWVPLEERG
ncbi:MAG TPA: citrate synthase/methylcitrate synthase [Anaerolineales bacterium]|nr:citrate synthase/methylcitrate synthase [Anaerolineales bacterium]